ncbi:MAG TPA: DUF1573 domain-containing protein [Thermoanaerobaculia bacterium]|nr:DUF1573 domain-containing protein [Thermoanaerobaculia bacterium]
MNRHVKTAILALCAVLLVATTLLAQAGKPKAVPVEPIKDAGVVPKGDKVANDFVIRNEGDAPLQITDVRASCGCTVVDFDKVIAPGQTGKVHAEVDTTTFNGPISKGVTVFTNDPEHAQIELTLRANVEPYIQAKPGYARYITVQGEEKTGTISQTIWSPDGTSFDVLKVDSPYPFLTTTYREAKPEERIPDVEGKQWRLEMALSNDAPVGALADYVRITTNHPKQKLVTIPISGFVRPVIAVTPDVADFGEIELKEPLIRELNVRNFATEPIKITSAEGSLPGMKAAVEPLKDGHEYTVRLTLSPQMAKGPFNGKLMLHTDSPKKPVVEVEMHGTVI